MKQILVLNFLLLFLIGCGDSASDSSCTDCSGSDTDGYQYKTVEASELTNLSEFNITSSGGCIRYKKDGTEYTEAQTVADCCCVEYE